MPIYALGDETPDIDPTAFVHPEAVLIGRVRIGAESTVWAHAVLRGDVPESLPRVPHTLAHLEQVSLVE